MINGKEKGNMNKQGKRRDSDTGDDRASHLSHSTQGKRWDENDSGMGESDMDYQDNDWDQDQWSGQDWDEQFWGHDQGTDVEEDVHPIMDTPVKNVRSIEDINHTEYYQVKTWEECVSPEDKRDAEKVLKHDEGELLNHTLWLSKKYPQALLNDYKDFLHKAGFSLSCPAFLSFSGCLNSFSIASK